MAKGKSGLRVRWQSIAERLRRGEPDALERVLGELGPLLAARLRQRFSGALSAEDIDDILAQTLYRIWVHRERYRPAGAPFDLWCYLIARNLALDVLRSKSRDRAALAALWTEFQKPSQASEPRAESADLVALGKLLAELPPVDRQIVFASVGDDEAWAAHLAKELGMSAAAIRQRRFRAMSKLRLALKASDIPSPEKREE